MQIIKKDLRKEPFDFAKIQSAVSKSAERVHYHPSEDEWQQLKEKIFSQLITTKKEEVSVYELHQIVESALLQIMPVVGQSYSNYRNYKKSYAEMMARVLASADDLNYHIDRSNANTSAALISTKRSLIYTALNKELYKKVFLSVDEEAAIQDGYIYIHDLGARMDTYNCCLFDMGKVLCGGFEWEHIGYNEPKDVRTACNLISDITLNCAAQQYGGFTIPEIDSILAPYAEKSYHNYYDEYIGIVMNNSDVYKPHNQQFKQRAHDYAWNKTKRDICQGFQGFEHTFNTVASSRGDYPFVTMTGGCEENPYGQLVWECALEVRKNGQGHPGKKRPAIFPKLVFIYTSKLHSEGQKMRHLFIKGVECSAVAMYPDWLSMDMPQEDLLLTTKNVQHIEPAIAKVFAKYHKFGEENSRWKLGDDGLVHENPNWIDSIISPMGKRKLQLISNFFNSAKRCGSNYYC